MQSTHAGELEKINRLIKEIEFAMLTTAAPDGSLRSRPMATQNRHFDGTLWFFTREHSGKTADVDQENQVNVSYASVEDQTYVSLSGRAQVVLDRHKAQQLWTPALKAWFPKGLDDPELALLKVEVDVAEYWDTSSSAMVRLAGFIKATVSGRAYNAGQHEKINLH